jgi:benzoyl-CoA reductase subunit C
MESFKELIDKRHEYAKEWKERTGGKILGYLCSYVPEEIAVAAGVLPVRILGSHEPQDVAERHIYSMFCPFCRDCLAQGLLGRYNYLDGLVMAHSCMHLRQTFFSWKTNIPLTYTHYIGMPSKPQSPFAKKFLKGELEDFKESLEEWTGKPIGDKELDNGIAILNYNRRLLREIYELRKEERPPLTGTEAMETVLSSQIADKAEHNNLLRKYLEEIRQKKGDGEGDRVRLMIIGSENDDTEMIKLAESLGAIVVIDDHCTGTRYFWNEVIPEEDRLSALSNRYLDRPRCPQKDFETRSRLPHITQLVKDYNVHGALVIQQKFCDPHELDIPIIMSYLKKELDIPSLFLECDVTLPAGQFRTRIEAFIETLQLEIV